MKTFKHFPEGATCILCGTNEDKPCTPIPIDKTDEGNICETIPVHIKCLPNTMYRYNKEIGLVYTYKKAVKYKND